MKDFMKHDELSTNAVNFLPTMSSHKITRRKSSRKRRRNSPFMRWSTCRASIYTGLQDYSCSCSLENPLKMRFQITALRCSHICVTLLTHRCDLRTKTAHSVASWLRCRRDKSSSTSLQLVFKHRGSDELLDGDRQQRPYEENTLKLRRNSFKCSKLKNLAPILFALSSVELCAKSSSPARDATSLTGPEVNLAVNRASATNPALNPKPVSRYNFVG